MSRSSDILSHLHKRRADRKKPKINAKLKKVSIEESQKGGIAAAQENKPSPMTVQKTGGRNSFALTFSVGLHVAIALLFGFFFIKDQIASGTEELEVALVPQEMPPRKRVDVVRPRETFKAKEQIIEAPIQSTPVNNTNILRPTGDFTLPSGPDTNFTPEAPSLKEGPKITEIVRGMKGPIQPERPSEKPTIDRPAQEKTPLDLPDVSTPSPEPTIIDPDIDFEEEGSSHPKIRIQIKPTYPKNAKRAQKEGKVILKATVGTDGIPKNIVAVTNLGFGFEKAAIDALKKFRFIPAKKKGKTIESTIQIPFEFKLEDK
jgi:TonB family protein